MEVLEAAYFHGELSQKTKENCRTIRAGLKAMLKDQAESALNRITRELGYGEYLERAGMGDGRLFVLRAIAKNEESPRRLLERLAELQQIIKDKPNQPDCRFILSTIHASKGLEYDAVYLMDVIDGIFPEKMPEGGELSGRGADGGSPAGTKAAAGNGRFADRKSLKEMFMREKMMKERAMGGNDPCKAAGDAGTACGKSGSVKSREEKALEAWEEERRLFYVGVTRAKERLFLFSVNRKSVFIKEFMRGPVPQAESRERKPELQIKPIVRVHRDVGLKKIFSEAGFRQFCEPLGAGLLVEHKKFGKGVIVEMDESWVVIRFEEKARRFELRTLYENGLLTF